MSHGTFEDRSPIETQRRDARLRLHNATNGAERAIHRATLERLGVAPHEIAAIERGAEIVRGTRR